jgi:hypothetical protein
MKSLEELDRYEAQLWFYTVSHSTLIILVTTSHGEKCYVYIDFVESLVVPSVCWENCCIRCEVDENGKHLITDRTTGLRILGNLVYVGPEDIGKTKNFY